jgi:cytochrome c553
MSTHRAPATAAWLAAAAMLLALAAPRATGQSSRGELPPGPMKQKAVDACMICHDGMIIVQQQLSRKMWTREVDKMIRWGAPVLKEDRDALIDYFVRNFPPVDMKKELAVVLPPGPGKDSIVSACSDCHDYHNIVEQRLDEKGWARILRKMEGFGADIYDDERDDMIHYLAKSFPPRVTASNDSKQP